MPDLDDRFRGLDDVRTPDLWTDISTREPGRPERRRSWASTVAILAAFAVLVGSIAWLAVSLAGRTDRRPLGSSGSVSQSPAPASPVPQSVVGLSTDGSVRCTASVDSDVVDPGDATVVHFTVENLSTSEVQIAAATQVLVDDASGDQVYDSFLAAAARFGGVQRAERLAPGMRLGLPAATVPIRWPGPLTLHAACPVPQGDPAGSLTLPPLTLRVANPGPAPDPSDAVAAALDAFAPLFATCRPEAGAGPVAGQVGPLPGIDAPPLDARCDAIVDSEPGFDVVTVTFVSPSDAEVPEIPDPLGANRPPLPSAGGSAEVWRAMVVVSSAGVFVVEQPQFEYTARAWTVTVSFGGGRWATNGEDACSSGSVTGSGGGVVFFKPRVCSAAGASPGVISGSAG